MSQPHILILNGSVRGAAGNSGALTLSAASMLSGQLQCRVSVLTLANPMPAVKAVYELLQSCDGLLVTSGVYWNSYGSPLQRFVEVATGFENSPAFFGKPVACALSMDSVGGDDVAARIHAVFSGLGCWSPPCSTLVLSRVGLEAIAASPETNEDVWRRDDLQVVLQNLVTATTLRTEAWVAWPHVSTQVDGDEWPGQGPLPVDTPRFL